MKTNSSQTIHMKTFIPLVTGSGVLIASACIALAQGNLQPPGAPAPAMKTLHQVEPRTPVDAVHTPGNFLAQFIITQPGSYYLTTNILA
jgi:hypothetical protein